MDKVKVCRICAVPSDDVLDMCNIDEDYKYEIINKIQIHLPIKMTVSDPLPASICVACLEAVKSWHEFVVTYLISEQQLKKTLGIKQNDDCFDIGSMSTFTVDDVLHVMSTHWQSMLDFKNTSHTDIGATEVSDVHDDDDHYADVVEPEQTEIEELPHKESTLNEPEDSLNNTKKLDKVKNDTTKKGTGKKLIKNTRYYCKQCSVHFSKSEDAVTHQISVHNVKVVCCTLCKPKKVFNISEESFEKHMVKYHRSRTKKTKIAPRKYVKRKNKRTVPLLSKVRTKASIITVHSEEIEGAHDGITNNLKNNNLDSGMENFDDKATEIENQDNLGIIVSSVGIINKGKGVTTVPLVKENGSTGPKLESSTETSVKSKLTSENEIHTIYYYCFVCYRPFLTKEECDIHYEVHLRFTCDICSKQFLSKCKLRTHMGVHIERKLVKCTECGKTFKTDKLLIRHQESHTKKTYLCETCGKVCTTITAMRYHQESHVGKRHICEICGKDVRNIRIHKKSHRNPETSFTCDECGKTFSFRSLLVIHMSLHTGEKAHKCPHCPKMFRTRQKCLQHLCLHKAPQFICEICYRGFRRKSHLVVHSRTHDPNKRKICTICKENFNTSNEMLVHRASHTEEEIQKQRMMHRGRNYSLEDFACDVCEKQYASKFALQAHYRKHTGEKPYKCSYCDSSFRIKNSLITHEYHHTGNAPFKCRVCDKGFGSISNLYQHNSVHFTHLPFTCTVCDRSFARRTYLINHIRIHTGERPFACRVCGRAFKQSCDRNKHEKLHNKRHNEKLHNKRHNEKLHNKRHNEKLHNKRHNEKLHNKRHSS